MEADLLGRIVVSGQATVSAEALSLVLAARCHEEVRVWIENFCRRHDWNVTEDAKQSNFLITVKGGEFMASNE